MSRANLYSAGRNGLAHRCLGCTFSLQKGTDNVRNDRLRLGHFSGAVLLRIVNLPNVRAGKEVIPVGVP